MDTFCRLSGLWLHVTLFSLLLCPSNIRCLGLPGFKLCLLLAVLCPTWAPLLVSHLVYSLKVIICAILAVTSCVFHLSEITVLPDVYCLPKHCFIYFVWFFVVSQKRLNAFPVIPFPEAEVLLLLIAM